MSAAQLLRSFTTGYGYDAASNRTGFTDPENGSTSYSYDTLNRVQTLTPPAAISGGNFGFGYDAVSRRTQITRPNSITTNYTYDNLSRLLSVLHQNGGSTIDGATYTVDAAGNRTAKTDQRAAVTSNYTYDAIYELTQVVQGSSTTESYTYDPVGNRLSSLGVSPYNYNASNELTSTPSTTYTYDANGNTLTSVTGSNTTTYAWDYENRLTRVTLPGSGGTVSFKYDPFGRRIYKSSSSGTSVFAYDGDNLVEETNSSGAVVARYTQTQNIDEPLAMLRSSATSYYNADGLGSITSLANGAGALAETYTIDSFGKQTASSGSLTNPFQYTGREFDSETNLYFYRARYYDQSAGRFLSEDPSRSGIERALYNYTDNSPVTWSDPEGLEKAQVCCRPLNRFASSGGRFRPLGFLRHCYIKFLTDAGAVTDTYGVLGNPGSTNNQIPRHGNGVFEDFTPGEDPSHPRADRNSGGKCKDLPASECQLQKLREGLDSAVRSGTCPSCGANYRRFSNNSNTFAYNMISGAGIQPPSESFAPGYHLAPGPWY